MGIVGPSINFRSIRLISDFQGVRGEQMREHAGHQGPNARYLDPPKPPSNS
jgi:hypothetical protein